MSNPLFLLGAGFNYDVKNVVGAISGYPLSSDLFKICFPGKENDPTCSIEELLDASINKNDFEPVKLLYDEIMKADYHLIPTLIKPLSSNCYATFFNKFKESSFLTFNYDSLVELFLQKLGQWYPSDGYGVPVETSFTWNIEIDEKKKKEYLKKSSARFVLHLHGSLCIYIKDFEKRNNQIKSKQKPTFKFDPGPLRYLFLAYERDPLDLSYKRHEERVIAPIPDKTEELKDYFIQQIYSKAGELLKTSNKLVVIGYNFSVHDQQSYHPLFDNWDGETLIISRNANELESRLSRDYPNIKWQSQSKSFREWVESDFAGL